jgi:hypothetical protein
MDSAHDTLLRAGIPVILRLFTNFRLFKIEHSQELAAEIDGRLAAMAAQFAIMVSR